ncbi:MAG: undecaprenyl-diphosphatase UppP [Patescibacteria group bacterium]|jgi:undecaprenyl-diphosphatase
MHDFLSAIVLGIVQGLAEFWPISSSGHLIIAHDVLNFGFVDNLTFDVALHMGTLLALVVFFWHDIIKYIVAFFRSLANWNVRNDFDQRMAWFVIIAAIPAGIGGFLLESWADTVFRNLWLVAALMIAVGVVFLIVEKKSTQTKDLPQATWKTALLIGLSQVIALLPGTSRSGITTLTGMTQGLKRSESARFSFLLSIPVILGAGLMKLYDATKENLTSQDWLLMAAGIASATLVGYFAIRFLLKYFQNHSLKAFAYYRFVIAGAVIVYMLVR